MIWIPVSGLFLYSGNILFLNAAFIVHPIQSFYKKRIYPFIKLLVF